MSTGKLSPMEREVERGTPQVGAHLHHGIAHEPQRAAAQQREQVAGRHGQHLLEARPAALGRLNHPRQQLFLQPLRAHRSTEPAPSTGPAPLLIPHPCSPPFLCPFLYIKCESHAVRNGVYRPCEGHEQRGVRTLRIWSSPRSRSWPRGPCCCRCGSAAGGGPPAGRGPGPGRAHPRMSSSGNAAGTPPCPRCTDPCHVSTPSPCTHKNAHVASACHPMQRLISLQYSPVWCQLFITQLVC